MLTNADRAINDVVVAMDGIETHLIDLLPELSEDLSESLNQFASLSRRLDNVIADNEQALSEFGAERPGAVRPDPAGVSSAVA